MRLNYNGEVIGTIATNHSMSIEDCIEILDLDTEKYAEIELFGIDYLDEYTTSEISNIYVQKDWSELSKSEKEYFLNIAIPIDGETCNTASEGECIVDFEGLVISISGKIVEGEIIINDDATFYNPAE